MEPDNAPTPPHNNLDLSFSQIVLGLAVTIGVLTASVSIHNIVKPIALNARKVAIQCAWVSVASFVVAAICGLLQLRRRTPDPAVPAPGANAPPDSLSAFRVVLGCIGGIVVVGGVFAWFDRGSDGLVFIGLGVILIPVMLVWKGRRFRWRQ